MSRHRLRSTVKAAYGNLTSLHPKTKQTHHFLILPISLIYTLGFISYNYTLCLIQFTLLSVTWYKLKNPLLHIHKNVNIVGERVLDAFDASWNRRIGSLHF